MYMKKIKILIASLFMVLLSTGLMAQPNPPGDHGSGDDEAPGGGAAIGGGLFVLLGLGAAYGGRKLYQLRSLDNNE